MAWFKRTNRLEPSEGRRVKIPEGLWVKCNNCRELVYRKELEKNFHVCPKCDYHFPISVEERIALILDEGSFKERDAAMEPTDPLNFKDILRYKDRLKVYQEKTGQRDAFIYGDGLINGLPVVFGVFNFSFMGGSMGCVVGEKIVRAAERSAETRHPLILVSSSGGARMQEGIFSLMQMVKTSAAVARLHEAGVPFISILTDPTFGGVTASFSMLGDIHIAEPKALIGFTGPRVIEQTIKQQLPEGFQRSEFLMEHGMLDMIVERKKLKETLSHLAGFFIS
ncbi:MAG: acetyl-CoA carboxylase carboxyltransferase subunit beta [Nitrospirae bacterium]|nr:acetyl-CoA carboxylase carboxyltransferase subunit beta [Nitrospirota bacterium]MBI3351441.1 acetyl-CoA carboxylase carboxyltransferase subunit beta [Nitrospirota bacterium]